MVRSVFKNTKMSSGQLGQGGQGGRGGQGGQVVRPSEGQVVRWSKWSVGQGG